MARWLAAAVVALSLLATAAPAGAQTAPCQFVLGFKTLHDLSAGDVGDCTDNQASAANGDAQQHTSKGLMAWRKADNWTAFTNGYTTWINGPNGLVSRLNTQRFAFEHDAGVLAGVWVCDTAFAKIALDGSGVLVEFNQPWQNVLRSQSGSPQNVLSSALRTLWFQMSSQPPEEHFGENRAGYPAPYDRYLIYRAQITKAIAPKTESWQGDAVVYRHYRWDGTQSLKWGGVWSMLPAGPNPQPYPCQ